MGWNCREQRFFDDSTNQYSAYISVCYSKYTVTPEQWGPFKLVGTVNISKETWLYSVNFNPLTPFFH